MPAAFFVLELNLFGMTRNLLFGGGALCGFQRGGVARKRLGENTVDLIGPAAIVFDDFIGDLGHGTPFGLDDDFVQ